MSIKLHKNGTVTIVINAADKLAVFSKEKVKVYQLKTFTHQPDSFVLLVDIAAETEYVSSVFAAETTVRIESGTQEALYQTGTGPVIIERRGLRGQGAPGALDTTGALTAAMMLAGIVTSAAATVAGTIPTGAVLDAAIEMEIGESFDWSLIKLGANDFTVTAAASGHTLVGVAVVSTVTTGVFRTQKTAAATYITYRVG
jgi:hypothetical protein